jgi:hypothetical protein
MSLDQIAVVSGFSKGLFEAVNQVVDITRVKTPPRGNCQEIENLTARPPANQRVNPAAVLVARRDELKDLGQLPSQNEFATTVDGNYSRAIGARQYLQVVRHLPRARSEAHAWDICTATQKSHQLPLQAIEPVDLSLKAASHQP